MAVDGVTPVHNIAPFVEVAQMWWHEKKTTVRISSMRDTSVETCTVMGVG